MLSSKKLTGGGIFKQESIPKNGFSQRLCIWRAATTTPFLLGSHTPQIVLKFQHCNGTLLIHIGKGVREGKFNQRERERDNSSQGRVENTLIDTCHKVPLQVDDILFDVYIVNQSKGYTIHISSGGGGGWGAPFL